MVIDGQPVVFADHLPVGTGDIDWQYVTHGSDPSQSRVIATRPLSSPGGWKVVVAMRRIEGRICVEEVAFRPEDDDATPMVGSEIFKRLRLAELQRDIERHMTTWPFSLFLPPGWDADTRLDRPRPGRAGRRDAFYALWAQRYVDALAETGGRPMPVLTDRFHESAASIRAFLGKARALGLLTEAPAGRAGGELTSKARALLGEES